MDPQQKTLHEQLSDYKRQHPTDVKPTDPYAEFGGKEESADDKSNQKGRGQNIKQAKGDIFDHVARECAAKVRKKYPRAYDDLDDETLVKKVLAKYPHYCNVGEGDPPGWEPVIQGIR